MSGPNNASVESRSENDDEGEPPRKLQKSAQNTQDSAECEINVSRMDIDKLPDEILVMILSHLSLEEVMDVTQNVCRRWRRLSDDPVLWRDLQFSIDRSYSGDEAVTMLQKIPQLHTLFVRRVVKSSVMNALCDNCAHLTTLELNIHQVMSSTLLAHLVQKCTNLQSLSIPGHLLFDEYNAQILAKLNRLQSLDLTANWKTIRLVNLRPIADGCPELVRLKMSKYIMFSLEEMEYFFNVKRTTLTHVTLPWVSHDLRCVVPLLEVCSSLSYLQLENKFGMDVEETAEGFAVLGRLPNLRSLIINNLIMYPAGAFESSDFSYLQVLDIRDSGLEDRVMLSMCRHCLELRKLYLRNSYELTDNGLNQLYRLTKLETLDLSDCSRLRGDALRHVAQLSNLKQLFLEGLRMFNLEPGLDCILDVTSLQVLDIGDWWDVRRFPFHRLPGKLVNLRLLVVGKVGMVDYGVLDWLQQQMPRLQVDRA